MNPGASSLSRSSSGAQFLAVRVQQCLQQASHAALRALHCDYHEGVLILRGHVPSYYLKQLAQELVARVVGIELIDNRIEVLRQGDP